MKDISGTWQFTFSPSLTNLNTIPRSTTATAVLEQHKSSNFLGLGNFVYGVFVSPDHGFFDTLMIPRLTMNDGSKTGATLGCKVKINIPAATPVHDNNDDEGPIRLSLAGGVSAAQTMISDPDISTIIMADDPTQSVRYFEWTAVFSTIAMPLDGGVPDLGIQDAAPTSGRRILAVGRRPKKKKFVADPDPAIKGTVALHLIAIDVENRRMTFEVSGLSRAPKANYFTFTDDRDRHFVALSVECAEPEPDSGNKRRCDVEIPAGYEKHKLRAVELHLSGLHGRTIAVIADELHDKQPTPENPAPN